MAVTEPLKVEIRNETGKQAAKRARLAGKVPGVVYAHGDPATQVSVSAREFNRVIRLHGNSSLVELDGLEGGKQLAIYKQLQVHPVSHEPLHVDFHAVGKDEQVSVRVDVRLKGLPVGVDKRGGTLVQTRDWIQVRCSPGDIPEVLVLDVKHLDVGDALHIGEAGISDKLTLITAATTTIATVTASRETLKAAEGEGEAPVAEGEAPAEETPAA